LARPRGLAAAKRLRLRAPPAPLATTVFRPRFYVVLRDAHGQEHRPPLVRRTWAECSVLVRDSEDHFHPDSVFQGLPIEIEVRAWCEGAGAPLSGSLFSSSMSTASGQLHDAA